MTRLICLLLVLALVACAPASRTVSPAHIVCVMDGETVWEYTVDSATVANGVITITLNGQSAPLEAPDGVTCNLASEKG